MRVITELPFQYAAMNDVTRLTALIEDTTVLSTLCLDLGAGNDGLFDYWRAASLSPSMVRELQRDRSLCVAGHWPRNLYYAGISSSGV